MDPTLAWSEALKRLFAFARLLALALDDIEVVHGPPPARQPVISTTSPSGRDRGTALASLGTTSREFTRRTFLEPAMSTEPEITAARNEVTRVRDRMSDTAAELEGRLTAPIGAVKEKLDVVQLVRDHPWPSLAVAIGAGVAVAASGADRRAASAVADASRSAARKTADAAKAGVRSVRSATSDAADSTAGTARHAPSRAHSAIVGALDSLAAKAALSLIEKLREPAPLPVTPEPSGLGYVRETTPPTGEYA